METQANNQDLVERLKLIEIMMAEGRHKTESWGWAFVLWGVAYFIAIAWTGLAHFPWAWPITMSTAVVVTAFLISRRRAKQPRTTAGRAISSLWVCTGITMMIFIPSLGISGRIDEHIEIAAVAALLGMTNAASSMILKWPMQFGCAVVWWAAAVAACFGTGRQTMYVFLGAIFICQIVFGVYCTIADSLRRRQRGAVNA